MKAENAPVLGLNKCGVTVGMVNEIVEEHFDIAGVPIGGLVPWVYIVPRHAPTCTNGGLTSINSNSQVC